MTQLTVIIPVYNVKAYLTRCIDCVIKECETLSYNVILVDDGSTDGSGTLCDELAAASPQITVLHKQNGGLSDARNHGIEQATGEYVLYLDSDDYLAEGGVKQLVAEAQNCGSDVVCGNFYYQYFDHADLFCPECHGTITLNGGEEALHALIEGRLYQNFAWGKLIRKELAQKHLFPKGKLFEDTYWFHHILHEANQVTVIDAPIVHYVQREGSISFNYSIKSLDILDGYSERLIFFEQNYPMLVEGHKTVMAVNCIEQAWMISRFIKRGQRCAAIKKLRDAITSNNLFDIHDKKKRCKLYMIMRHWILLKGMTVIEKIMARI